MSHTKTPWKVLALTYEDATTLKVVPCNNREPAYFMIGGDNRKANAEYIVRCCNSHDELVEALKRLMIAGEPFTSGDTVDEVSGTIPLMEEMKAALEQAENAITKAERGRG